MERFYIYYHNKYFIIEYEKLKRNFITAEDKINTKDFQPASYLRRTFIIEKEIQKAKLNITACRLYKGYFGRWMV
ncbi:MAG: hypothetical protein ACOC4M_05095 [Promethearchaeia archaeon]